MWWTPQNVSVVPQVQCDWTSVRVGRVAWRHCARLRSEAVSDLLKSRSDGLPDCHPLLNFPHSGLALDIGANIGGCTMLLLAAGFRVAAFEPSPESAAHLLRSAEPYAERLRLFPALGAHDGASHQLVQQTTNAGNAQLDKGVPDPGHVMHVEEGTRVHSRTLDVLLHGAPRHAVTVAKMDVQGYESNVLAGGSHVLRRGVVGAMYFECEDVRLWAHGSGPVKLLRQMRALGFEVMSLRGEEVHSATRMRQVCGVRARAAFGSVNLYAVHTLVYTPSEIARCLREGRHGCFGNSLSTQK